MSKGPAVPVSEFVERALYAEGTGFYERGGRAGRRGDFVTSPEVGPLFGTVLGLALDGWWEDQGRPDPFVVHEHGAGPGTLARGIVQSGPACGSALRWVLVERSAVQRDLHPDHLPHQGPVPDGGAWAAPGGGPLVASAATRPEGAAHVVVANELLDNLPFDLAERATAGWREVRLDPHGGEVLVDLDAARVALLDRLAPDAGPGARVPIQGPAGEWVASSLAQLAPGGRLIVVDYASTTAALAGRPWREWVRTYRGHAPGGSPWEHPGHQDVTVEVALDQVALATRPPDLRRSQADALRAWGIDAMVAEGRQAWAARTGPTDLALLRARSRVTEADALLDPAGLGRFVVAEWSGSDCHLGEIGGDRDPRRRARASIGSKADPALHRSPPPPSPA